MIDKGGVWLITGCSKGLGLALAKSVLAKGYRVVATARHRADLKELAERGGDDVLCVELDVTDRAQVTTAVAAAEEAFGSVDVLVNNAGYGYLAAIEEGEDEEVRALFETDLFAPVDIIKAVLPGMRARRRGHIVNISSIGGLVTYPGIGYYHMAKFALEALSDTLAKEVAPLGIGVTVVAPGAFRTGFRGPTSIRMSREVIEDYADTAGQARERTLAGHGHQQGDPERGAEAILTALEAERPPVHLLIGSDAVDQWRARLDGWVRELDSWEQVSRGTDFVTPDLRPRPTA